LKDQDFHREIASRRSGDHRRDEAQWLPMQLQWPGGCPATVSATAEVIDRFRAAPAARGIVPTESIIAGGAASLPGLTQPPYQYTVIVR